MFGLDEQSTKILRDINARLRSTTSAFFHAHTVGPGFREIDRIWSAYQHRMIWNVPERISMSCPECHAPYALHGVLVWEGGEYRRKYNVCARSNPYPELASERAFFIEQRELARSRALGW